MFRAGSMMPRAALLTCLALIAVAILVRQRKAAADVLASTTCPFRGTPVVVVRPGLAPADTLPVRVHEEVHRAQCTRLGPVRYRIINLTGSGTLSLEVPAYCAAAAARIRSGWTQRAALERLHDDIYAAMSGRVDSSRIASALRRDCPASTGS